MTSISMNYVGVLFGPLSSFLMTYLGNPKLLVHGRIVAHFIHATNVKDNWKSQFPLSVIMRTRVNVLERYNRDEVKSMMRGKYVRGTLFDIPPNHPRGTSA